MSGTIIPAKYDFIFRRVFGAQQRVKTLAAFLQAVLGLPESEFKTLTLRDPTLIPRYQEGKRYVVDLSVVTSAGKTVNIEIQLADRKEVMRERIVASESRTLGDQLQKGQDYGILKKVITILIADFDLIPESAAYHHKFNVRDEYDPRIILTDIFEIHTLELKKIPPAEDGSGVWRWLKLLKTDSEEELDMLQQNHPELLEPVAILKELSADELLREEQRAYERACWDEAAMKRVAEEKGRAEGLTEGEAIGEARGRAEGEARGLASVARSMLKRQMPIDVIVELTGLAREEVVLLQQQ